MHLFHIWFIHSPVRHLGHFHMLAIVNNAATNMVYTRVFKSMLSVLLGICQKDHTVIPCFVFWGTPYHFPQRLYHFTFLLAMHKNPSFSTCSLTRYFLFLFCNSHPNRCKVILYWLLFIHPPTHASFHSSICLTILGAYFGPENQKEESPFLVLKESKHLICEAKRSILKVLPPSLESTGPTTDLGLK